MARNAVSFVERKMHVRSDQRKALQKRVVDANWLFDIITDKGFVPRLLTCEREFTRTNVTPVSILQKSAIHQDDILSSFAALPKSISFYKKLHF